MALPADVREWMRRRRRRWRARAGGHYRRRRGAAVDGRAALQQLDAALWRLMRLEDPPPEKWLAMVPAPGPHEMPYHSRSRPSGHAPVALSLIESLA
eukprot:SM008265S22704  [mRNA]  locus=s8265:155:458:+ [translate_table: standard]